MAKILVADDNSNIQKMVTLALKDQGIEVVAVGNGEAAVRKLPDLHPDLVLADIFMPVRNGYEVCEFVKHDARFAHIPVILLVGAFDPLDEHEVQRVGADGVLKKPFVPPDPLIAMVKSVLARLASENLAPVAVPAAPPAPARVETALSSREALAEEPPADYAVRPSPVVLGDGEKPLAFGELLQAPVAELAPEPEPAPLRDTGLGEIGFWQAPAASEQPAAGPESPGWLSSETVWPPRENASQPSPLEVAAEEPSGSAPLHVQPGPPEELVSSATEWLETVSAHPPAALAPDASESWDNAPPVEAEATPTQESSSASSEVATKEAPGTVAPPGGIPSATSVPPTRAHETEIHAPAGSSAAAPAAGGPEQAALCATEADAVALPSAVAPPEAAPPRIAEEPAEHATELPATPWATPPVPSAIEPEPARLPAAVEPAYNTSVQSSEVPQPPTPELVEAVVAKVLERMQPQILDIVTREILRPVVAALVRRELEKP